MPRSIYLAFSNPVPGREDEFNDWFDNRHIPDWMQIEGLVSLQRFRRTVEQRSEGPHPWEYLIVYECEAADRVKVIEQLSRVSGTAIMPATTSMSGGGYACWFEAIGNQVTP